MTRGPEQLTARRREATSPQLWSRTTWAPGNQVSRSSTVLQLSHDGVDYIVKAADETNHHLARELRAHHCWLGPWTS